MRGADGKFAAVEDDGRCHVPGCDGLRGRKSSGKFTSPIGLCNKHYLRLRKTGKTELAERPVLLQTLSKPTVVLSKCRTPGCGETILGSERLCTAHKEQYEERVRQKKIDRANRAMTKNMLIDAIYNGAKEGLFAREMARELDIGYERVLLLAKQNGIILPDGRESRLKATYAPVTRLADQVVRPGIDKHLMPVLMYRGNLNIPRAHRFWNFILAMMEQECQTPGSGVWLSHNAAYSHLCGPEKKISHLGLYGFLSRLQANPRVTDNIPGLTDYVRSIGGWRFSHIPVSQESKYKNHASWRTYVRKARGPGNIKPARVHARDAIYPYVMHDGKTDAGVDLVKEVNRIVPRGLDEQFRSDVCQDIICAILAGDTTLAELEGADVRKFVSTARNIFSNKWDFISIDEKRGDGDGRTFLDTFDVAQSLWGNA